MVRLRKFLVAGLLVVLMAMAFSPVSITYAQDAVKEDVVIQISPLKQRQKLEPGQKYSGSFDIYNRGAKSFDFKVYVKPFSISSDCTDNYEVPNEYTQLSKWVTFEQLNYYGIKPEEKRQVHFTVDVPKDAPSGGQYVVIFAETGEFDPKGGTTIGVNKRVGYKFYADLGGTDKQSGKVESVKQGSWFWEPPIGSYSQVRNTGNVDFTETHDYTVTDLSGKVVYENSQTGDVLPDTCRTIKHSWNETPSFGLFWVENKVEFLGHEQFSGKKLVLVIPVYIVVIFVAVAVLLLWALVLKIKGGSKKRTIKIKR